MEEMKAPRPPILSGNLRHKKALCYLELKSYRLFFATLSANSGKDHARNAAAFNYKLETFPDRPDRKVMRLLCIHFSLQTEPAALLEV